VISADTIQQILNVARIDEVIGDFMTLKKRGINMIGNCPFHDEKSPSFTVSPAKGIYKCFGCGKAGNVTKFVMEHEHLTYPESLEYLAKKYNIQFDNIQLSPKQIEEQKGREILFTLHQVAKDFFVEQLWNTDEGKTIGLTYFKERQLSEAVMKKFELGYNPDAEQAFTNYALQKGYSLDDLKRTGITTQQRNADFFRGRIIFPIHNITGKVIAFGGRTLKKDKNTAKYFNSPESDIYHKSKVLYGLYQARNAILKNTFCYLVEGYLDVISLQQGGIENVAASSGTALTIDQIKLIKRYTNNIILLYDSDAAGVKAALRGLELIIEEGLNLKLVLLPEGEDPDSYIHKNGAAGFNDFVKDNAKDFIRFKIQNSIEQAKNDPYQKAAITKDIIGILTKIPDGFVRGAYIKEFSSMMQLSEELVNSEVNKLMRTEMKKKSDMPDDDAHLLYQQAEPNFSNEPQQPNFFKTNQAEEQEKNIIRILLEWGSKTMTNGQLVAQVLFDEIDLGLIDNINCAKMFNAFLQQFETEKTFDSSLLINSPEEDISTLSAELLKDEYTLSENWEKKHQIFIKPREMNFEADVKSSIHKFKTKKLQKLQLDNMKKLKEAPSEEEQVQIQFVHIQLSTMIAELANASGTVVIGRG
jgi:DNA primase